MISEWNSVVGEGGLGNCTSLSVLSQESSVVRQGLVSVIWYTNFATDCFYDTCLGPVIEKFVIVRP